MKSFKMKWKSEDGSDWMHDGEEYADMDDVKITASMAYEDGYIDAEDTVMVFEVNTSSDPVSYLSVDDFPEITLPVLD